MLEVVVLNKCSLELGMFMTKLNKLNKKNTNKKKSKIKNPLSLVLYDFLLCKL